jgi:predicted enzyme involved in methoxymalonyl-ACP biosynthesis
MKKCIVLDLDNTLWGGILDSTFCYTANESGKKYHPLDGEIEDLYHSSIRDFKFVPYPHELEKLKTKQD